MYMFENQEQFNGTELDAIVIVVCVSTKRMAAIAGDLVHEMDPVDKFCFKGHYHLLI